jgi:hypothetical protein
LVACSGELEGPFRIVGTAGVWDGSSAGVVRCNSWFLLRKVRCNSFLLCELEGPLRIVGTAGVWGDSSAGVVRCNSKLSHSTHKPLVSSTPNATRWISRTRGRMNPNHRSNNDGETARLREELAADRQRAATAADRQQAPTMVAADRAAAQAAQRRARAEEHDLRQELSGLSREALVARLMEAQQRRMEAEQGDLEIEQLLRGTDYSTIDQVWRGERWRVGRDDSILFEVLKRTQPPSFVSPDGANNYRDGPNRHRPRRRRRRPR